MGRGNPESADAIFARESNVFVADKLNGLNFVTKMVTKDLEKF